MEAELTGEEVIFPAGLMAHIKDSKVAHLIKTETQLFLVRKAASVPLASEDSQIGVRMRVCLYGQDRTHPGSS
jgi:hypothetical protein